MLFKKNGVAFQNISKHSTTTEPTTTFPSVWNVRSHCATLLPLCLWLFQSQEFANVGSHSATLLPPYQYGANVNNATYHIPHWILTPPLPPHLHNLCKTDFSKAKSLPMLAATVQHCYHSANVLLMLTLLPTTYPIQFLPLHSLHTSTTFAKLPF